jgi:hypothetical protein
MGACYALTGSLQSSEYTRAARAKKHAARTCFIN